jgi:phospholipid/cholesterol/gamma-HCH transport system substrate-binding protein
MEISNKNKQLKTAVWFLIGLALVLIIVIFYILGTNQKMFSSSYQLNMFLPTVQELKSGAFVNIAGVKAGVVGDMEFTKRNGERGVKVKLIMDEKYRELITKSSTAKIKTTGMLGSQYVYITLGKENEKPLGDKAFIKSELPTQTSEVIYKASAAMDEFKSTLKSIRSISDDIDKGSGVVGSLLNDESMRNDLAVFLNDISSISNSLEKGKGSAGKFIKGEEFYNSLNNTAQNLEKITDRLEQGKGSMGKLMTDTSLYNKLESVSDQSDKLLKKLQGDGTVGKLMTEKELYDQLIEVTDKLNTLLKEIKENPDKYFNVEVF